MMSELPVVNNSPCLTQGCAKCCYETEMLLTEADVSRMTAATNLDANTFSFRASDGYRQLRTQDAPGLPCYFLVDDRCSIFAARPEGCRMYPAVLGDDVHLDEEHCPHTDGFVLTGQAKAAVRRIVGHLEREP